MRASLKLTELITDEKYKKMDVKELTYVIDYLLDYNEYTILNGRSAEGKAVNLYSYFNM